MLLEHPVDAAPLAGPRPVHRLTPGTELVGEYQGSGLQTPRFLICRADGQVVQVPALLYRVAGALDGRRDDAALAAQLSAELGQELTADQVTFLVEEKLRPAGVVAEDGDGEADGSTRPSPVRSDPLLALRFRVGVVPERVVWRLAGPLRFLFRRPAWLMVLTAFAVVGALVAAQGALVDRTVSGVEQVIRHPGLVLAFLVIEVVAAVFHETGHVTACRYGGARPGDMGVGIYLVWPAFYSTVTDSYRLDRVGRLRTDLGGVYFNTVFLTCLGAVYLQSDQPWLLLVLIAWLSDTLWQFLPSIRLDGYYILADLAGVPDLFGYVVPALKSLAPGRPTHPRVRELRPWPRRIIVGWVAATIPTLAFYLVAFLVVLPRALPTAARELARYGQELEQAVRAGHVLPVVLGSFQGFLLVLPWIGSALVTVSVAGRLRRTLVARWGRGRVRPGTWLRVRRHAALAGTGCLAALLVVRVGWVGASLPAAAPELGLADAPLAAAAGGPVLRTGAVGEPLPRLIASWLAPIGPSGPPTGLRGVRALALLCAAALVVSLLVLASRRRTRLVSVVLPLAVLAVMGPAVSVLAAGSPALVSTACTAAGLLALGRPPHRHCRHRGWAVLAAGTAATVVGLVLCPLVCLPLAAAAVVPLLRGTGSLGTAAVRPLRAVAAVLLLCVAALAAVQGTPVNDGVLGGAERTVLLLVAGLVTIAGGAVRRLRPWAAAAAAAVLVAALPWSGAGSALPLVVATATPLAVLLVETVAGTPVAERPHPLLRAAVAVPLLAVVIAGALFTPPTAAGLPDAALASWISGPLGPTTRLAAPPQVAAQLVARGVPAERLAVVEGTLPSGMWVVVAGDGAPPGRALARFGSGAATLTVLAPQRVATGAADVQLAARQAAAEARERVTAGTALAGNPHLTAPPDVLLALASGRAGARLLRGLTALTSAHTISLEAAADPASAVSSVPLRTVLVTAFDGRPTTSPSVAGELGAALHGAGPSSTPASSVAALRGVAVSW